MTNIGFLHSRTSCLLACEWQSEAGLQRLWKTQPSKSPLSGELVTQFPPDKGGQGGLGMTNIGFSHSRTSGLLACEWQSEAGLQRLWKTQPPKSPLSGGLVTQFLPDKGGKGG